MDNNALFYNPEFTIFRSLKPGWIDLISEDFLLKLFECDDIPDWALSALPEAEVARRSKIANNPNTSISVLALLAKDSYWYARVAIATHPNTPIDVLAQLAKDPDEYVQHAIAAHPNTPTDALIQLAKNPNWYVRRTVAVNPNTPRSVLAQLTEDSDWEVSRAASSALDGRNSNG